MALDGLLEKAKLQGEKSDRWVSGFEVEGAGTDSKRPTGTFEVIEMFCILMVVVPPFLKTH